MTSVSPSRTIVTNFADGKSNYEEGVWVLDVCAGSDWVGCGLTNGTIQVYRQGEVVQSYNTSSTSKEKSVITDMTTDGCHALMSCSKNGSMRLFDVRQPSPALEFSMSSTNNKNEEALSVDLGYGGVLAAVGSSKNPIHFFDIRGGGKLLGSYVDAHTEEVTRVRFQPGGSGMLVSASEDGLACVFDTSQASEEAALQGVLNTDTPLRDVGFFGPSYEGVYCLTGSETLSVWHHESAQRICDFGGIQLREQLAKVSGMTVDYLVGCQWHNDTLSLLTGSHAGAGTVFTVEAGTISPLQALQNGHKGDIRSWCRVGNEFCTVGEDARLCEWNPSSATAATTTPKSGAKARRPKSKKKTNSNPY